MFYKKTLRGSFKKPITKKDIFLGSISSYFAILIYINIIYLTNIIGLFYEDNTVMTLLSIPALMCVFPLSFYFYNIYKQKMLYMFIRNKKNNKLLSFFLITIICSVFFISDAVFLFFLIMALNSTLCVILYLYYHLNVESFYNLKTEAKFVFLDDMKKIKLAIINPSDNDLYLTFLFDMKFFFHPQYVVFKGYKISYSDLTSLERNFNKTLYNFNDDELKIIEMYAFN
jgi:hypothetical protein